MKVFSVVLATHNEALNLETCLASIANLADEIVIVDGDSTDETTTIAKSYGARIISTTNKINFHINKQLAIDAATGELVLQLDADEVVDAELVSFLEQLKQKQQQQALPLQPVAWFLRRKNFLFGRWLSKGGQYPDPVIRLFKKGMAHLPQADVHEQMKVDGEIGTAPGHLLHYSYPTFADYVHKFNTYTSFSAIQLASASTKTATSPLVYRYFIGKPIVTFYSLYLRHRGYVDGMAGFVFAVMSALHHPFVYLKYWEITEKNRLKYKKSVP